MKVRFSAAAEYDLYEAVVWYEESMPGLGTDFLTEADRAIRLISRFPEAANDVGDGLRRVLIKRYPYGIWYAIEKEIIIVYAIAHLHRQPRNWQDRNSISS